VSRCRRAPGDRTNRHAVDVVVSLEVDAVEHDRRPLDQGALFGFRGGAVTTPCKGGTPWRIRIESRARNGDPVPCHDPMRPVSVTMTTSECASKIVTRRYLWSTSRSACAWGRTCAFCGHPAVTLEQRVFDKARIRPWVTTGSSIPVSALRESSPAGSNSGVATAAALPSSRGDLMPNRGGSNLR